MSKSSRLKHRSLIRREEEIQETPVAVSTENIGGAYNLPGFNAPRIRQISLITVVLFLSLFVLGNYARIYDPHYGWSKLDGFGKIFEKDALPRLKRNVHYLDPVAGYDGQFYAQLAIDPTLSDPAFDRALDLPVYRARRIGLPAISFCLGWAKPRRIIQAYALTNLIFWFVLLGALLFLSRPWTGKQQLCMSLGLMSFGSIASMQHSFVDLPTTAMIFVGIVLGGWGGSVALAAAALTRETSLLAALGNLDLRRPFTTAVWKRNLMFLVVASVPIALWMLYLRHRFDGLQAAAGYGNFGFPLQAMAARLLSSWGECVHSGLNESARAAGPFGWLYLDEKAHEVFTITALFFQGLYLALRWNPSSAVWRTGICFAALGCILGPAVWEWTCAAARVLLPMTICYYLLVSTERDRWFWPFFLLGSLSVPFAVHDFWVFS